MNIMLGSERVSKAYAMTNDDEPKHRSRHRSAPGDVALREDADDEDMMELRIPIASTGEVRNEGDDPLSAAELRGMAAQVNDLTTGVFPEHGAGDMIDGGHYSQFEKLGYWAEGDLESEAADDGADLLMATARMPDPETLPAATAEYRTALAILKEQAKRGIPIDASIGWRDDESFEGGVDLMETSIVGIGADPRTNTADADPVATVTRAAVDAGADPEALVERVQAVTRAETDTTMTDEDDPGDDTGTDDAQDADDGETTERAPDDVTVEAFDAFVAAHQEGADADDVGEALDGVGEWVGAIDTDELAGLVALAADTDPDTVLEFMTDEMDDGDDPDDEQMGDKDEDEDDEEDEEQAADADDAEERSADTDDDGEKSDLAAEVRELREAYDELSEQVATEATDAPGDEQADDRDAAESEATDADDEPTDDRTTNADPADGLGDYMS